MSSVKGKMSNAYVDPCDMLNNFCFHVYAHCLLVKMTKMTAKNTYFSLRKIFDALDWVVPVCHDIGPGTLWLPEACLVTILVPHEAAREIANLDKCRRICHPAVAV